MKTKKKKSAKRFYPLNHLIFILESSVDALEKHNFNLSEVWLLEYFQKLPQEILDQPITKSIYHALQKRDSELLKAAVEAELERLRTEKVKTLRDRVIG